MLSGSHTISLSGVSSASDFSLSLPLRGGGRRGIFKTHTRRPGNAALVNIGCAESAGECGETELKPCTQSWSNR